MKRNGFLAGMLAVTLVAGNVFAQEGEDATKPERRRYVGRFSEPKQQLEVLTEELTLDAAQQQQLMPILETHHQKFQELAKEAEPTPEMEQARRQNRLAFLEARKNGDKALEKKLREEQIELTKKLAEQILPVQDKLEALQDEMQENISGLLRPEQKTKFDTFWDGGFGTHGASQMNRSRNPQMLLRHVQRLRDLTPAQKTQVDTLFKTYKEAAQAPGQDKKAEMAGRRERDSKLYDEVMALLTDAQKEEINKTMKEQTDSLRKRHAELRKQRNTADDEKPAASETKPEENKGS